MNNYRGAFPIFSNRERDVYLDSAATTQKPRVVLDALEHYYTHQNANVHRGVHELSEIATEAFEGARKAVASFINATSPTEIIWTRGTTEAINLVANVYRGRLQPGDEVLISEMEHHSNIVPWQMACDRTGAVLRAVKVCATGELDLDSFHVLLSDKTKVVALQHASNALGTVHPIRDLTELAHQVGAKVLIDGAQGVPHLKVDVQNLDCDFYAFSGHKMYGPTGIGVLYGKAALLESAEPWQGGGEMIQEVHIESSTYQKLPHRFEAGTPDISGAVGMRAAVEFLRALGLAVMDTQEQDLLRYATANLRQIDGIDIYADLASKVPIVSFNLKDQHHSDVGVLLDKQRIGVRTGHHCAMPLMRKLGIPGTVRVSLGIYNSREDIDKLIVAIDKARHMLSS